MSLARELKKQAADCQLVYVGHKGDNLDSLTKTADDFDFKVFIKAGKFRRYHNLGFFYQLFKLKTLLLNIRDFFRLPGSIISAYRIMRRFKPEVVFSKGGFVAVPVGIAARLRRVPIVTHDSDTMPGLANRIVGRWASVHATGMPASFYNYPKSKTEYVGIPIDSRIRKVTPKIQKAAKRQLKIPPDGPVLLLSGGGNGSKPLNDLLLSVSRNLLEVNLSLIILHLAGEDHYQTVKSAYKRNLTKEEFKRVKIEAFTNEFYLYGAAADLVIARAGASTLADLGAAGKACIIIPSPYLAGGHQLKNAEQLKKNDAAVVLEENTSPDELLAVINELLSDDSRRWQLAKNLYATSRPDAAARLAAIILRTAGAQD